MSRLTPIVVAIAYTFGSSYTIDCCNIFNFSPSFFNNFKNHILRSIGTKSHHVIISSWSTFIVVIFVMNSTEFFTLCLLLTVSCFKIPIRNKRWNCIRWRFVTSHNESERNVIFENVLWFLHTYPLRCNFSRISSNKSIL